MQTLSKYEIHSTLHEGIETIVYRGHTPDRQELTILKLLKAEYPTLQAITRLKHEYLIRQNLNHPQIIKFLSIENFHHRIALLLEDIGGKSLNLFLRAKKLDIYQFLSVAIQVTQALDYLHQNQIVHKDIKPSNIIINPQTNIVKLTDFGIASRLTKENPLFNNPNCIEGTLAYMSPEQTGRMNRTLDYRTDFYSHGVTCYEILTGQLPFDSNDPLEIVYDHIAREPIPLQQLNPEIPTAISEIVRKLMAKNAEDRYQCAAGILADLEICLNTLQNPGTISDFIPGRFDVLSQLLMPQKLYGIEQQVKQLLAAFELIATGSKTSDRANQKANKATPLILVSGYSGIGKSALVNEINKPITRLKGYFVWGKFDQFKRNIPYASFSQALGSLMRQILTESTAQIQEWRSKILTALESNRQIIADLIPEVELIIGKQPSSTEAINRVPSNPSESQNRFNLVFKAFIRVFTQKEHPLVIFLDDLQWADSATLKLMELLVTDPESEYLLFVGADRDNEVSPIHPLMQTIAEIEKTRTKVDNIVLEPLDLDRINQLMADTLNDAEGVAALANLILHNTAGNPFFITQLLQGLYQENLLRFDFNSLNQSGLAGIKGGWKWSLSEIQGVGIADRTVVELVVRRLQKLPESTQSALKLAACIGDKFTLNVLSIVSEQSPSAIAHQLDAALQIGLLLPLNQDYKMPVVFEEVLDSDERLENQQITQSQFFTIQSKISGVKYKFLHDRVQQAAYSMIPEFDKQQTHLKIGQLLLSKGGEGGAAPTAAEIEENIFEIVNHLNIGADLLSDDAMKLKLAELNLIAGEKAKSANAYETAVKYLNAGLGLLAEDSWISDYELTLALYVATMEAEYLNTNYQQAKVLIDIAIAQAKTLLDSVKIYTKKIQFYTMQGDFTAGIDSGLEILTILGTDLPTDAEGISNMSQDLRSQLTFETSKIAKLVDLPLMEYPTKLAATNILISILPPVYFAMPQLLGPLILSLVNLAVNYGNAPSSSYGYCLYGLLLCSSVFDDTEAGYEFGKLSLQLLEKFPGAPIECEVYKVFCSHIQPWKEPLRQSVIKLTVAIKTGLKAGNIEYTNYGIAEFCIHSFLSGENLQEVENKTTHYELLIDNFKLEFGIFYLRVCRQTVLNLAAKSENNCILTGSSFSEETMLPVLLKANYRMVIFLFHLFKSRLFYLFKDYESAIIEADKSIELLDAALAMIYVAEHNLYHSLALLANYSSQSKSAQKASLQKVEANQKQMQKWVSHAPKNFQHKYDLVSAEKARVLNYLGVMEYYDSAIAGAKAQGHIHEEALANELAGQFYLSCGKEKIAKVYLTDAYYAYIRWGALAKVKDLESRYDFLESQTHSPEIAIQDVFRNDTGSSSSIDFSSALDLASFIKFSQTISSEIVLENLLSKLIEILLENAGAQKALLLLQKDEKLYIEAVGNATEKVASVLQSISVEKSQDLPISVVNYVFHSQENLILNDATIAEPFNADTYINKNQTRSILCVPILYQSQLQGIIYLENNLTVGAFTTERVEVLNVLVSQAAIAIINAQLYAQVRASESQLRQFFDAIPVGVFVINQRGIPYYANEVGKQILGKGIVYTSNLDELHEVYQAYLAGTDQIYPNDRAPMPKALQGLNTKIDDMEIRQGGKNIPIEVLATPIYDEAGNVAYASAAFSDITERKKHEAEREKYLEELSKVNYDLASANQQLEDYSQTLEEKVEERTAALQAAQKQMIAQEKLSSLGMLTAGVAHELRNPLNFVNNYAELSVELTEELLAEIESNSEHLDADTRDYIKEMLTDIKDNATAIHEHGQRADTIIHSMMQHARIDSGHRQRADLNALLDQAVDLAYQSRRASDDRFNAIICKDYDRTLGTWDVVAGDLSRAFINLIDNACYAVCEQQKYLESPADSQPQIFTSQLCIKTQNLGNVAQIRIRDNGKGIPAEILDKIFNPFFTTKPAGERTGLGLSLTHDIIVGQHGGTLQVETEPGVYTEFIIRLPQKWSS
ncbi:MULTISPECIES: AAA family ATPase [unclassified Microcoleus]|uniref:protein kinase domain-containing protein n=1 Tax=unclassified Microcoleus TaxID=2642155 RepID=UPI002FCF9B9F